jgi:hypothetical protein
VLLEVAELSRLKRIQMSIVFDGQPARQLPPTGRDFVGSNCTSRVGVEALMTASSSFVEQSGNRHNLTVVTSDRGLARRVEAEGVKTIRSGEIRQNAGRPGRVEIPERLEVTEAELPEWMRYFGVSADDDVEDLDGE